MSQPILFIPNQTGSGHNMRTFAIARELVEVQPDVPVVVLLSSLQDVFGPLFEQIGVEVVLTNDADSDHSKTSHLTTFFNKEGYIDKYLVPTFVNGSKLLDYLALFQRIDPKVIVSDYNLTASIAAVIGGYEHILVTERYDFSIVQLSDKDLIEAGFEVEEHEMASARSSLTLLFSWIIEKSRLVLTDKPPMKDLDSNTALYRHFDEGKVRFLGPLVRRPPRKVDDLEVRRSLGLKSGPIIVASVGGTTMFMENKVRAIEVYEKAFRLLRKEFGDAQMVLIGRSGDRNEIDGITLLDFVPEWMPLLTCACALVAQPGWITVTEAAMLNVPTVFALGGRGEYHEIEALKRLRNLGFPALVEPSATELYSYLRDAVLGRLAESCATGFSALAPYGRGTVSAAKAIAEVI